MHPIMPHRHCDLALDPELATLAVLDAALQASRAALIAEHPDARSLVGATELLPPIIVFAGLVVERTIELRALLAQYRRAVYDFREINTACDSDQIPF